MGKGDKTQGRGGCAFRRMNYLYQAAHLTLSQNPGNTELIRFYAHSLKTIAKRECLRLHPNIKRTLCKKCFMLLVEGVTAKVRLRGNRQKHTVITCMECGTLKRFVAKADHQLHGDNPGFIVNKTQLSQPFSKETTIIPATQAPKTEGKGQLLIFPNTNPCKTQVLSVPETPHNQENLNSISTKDLITKDSIAKLFTKNGSTSKVNKVNKHEDMEICDTGTMGQG